MNPPKNPNGYALDQSPIYKISTKKKLATLIKTSLPDLNKLLKEGNNYRVFKIDGRVCHEPKPKMKRIHKRLQILLSRITSPIYLHSATKGRSYITNAKEHLGGDTVHKLDIKKFYDSTTFKHVYDFYKNIMLCPKDVATVLAKISTYNDHLPTGSPLSPILAYFAHKKMFDGIYASSVEADVKMTCYVDDIAFSSEKMPKGVVARAKAAIIQRGLKFHKEKRFFKNDTKIITGVALSKENMLLPNRRHKKIYEEKVKSREEKDSAEKRKSISKLISLSSEAAQVQPQKYAKLKEALKVVRRKILEE